MINTERSESGNQDLHSEEDGDRLIEQVAEAARRLRLEAPLLFLLEAHLPLSSLAHTLALLVQPVASPLLGASRMHRVIELLGDRARLEQLACLLEEKSGGPTGS